MTTNYEEVVRTVGGKEIKVRVLKEEVSDDIQLHNPFLRRIAGIKSEPPKPSWEYKDEKLLSPVVSPLPSQRQTPLISRHIENTTPRRIMPPPTFEVLTQCGALTENERDTVLSFLDNVDVLSISLAIGEDELNDSLAISDRYMRIVGSMRYPMQDSVMSIYKTVMGLTRDDITGGGPVLRRMKNFMEGCSPEVRIKMAVSEIESQMEAYHLARKETYTMIEELVLVIREMEAYHFNIHCAFIAHKVIEAYFNHVVFPSYIHRDETMVQSDGLQHAQICERRIKRRIMMLQERKLSIKQDIQMMCLFRERHTQAIDDSEGSFLSLLSEWNKSCGIAMYSVNNNMVVSDIDKIKERLVMMAPRLFEAVGLSQKAAEVISS